jgi:hypothetical protein
MALVACFVWDGFSAIEDVIGAEKHKSRTEPGSRLSHVDRATGIYGGGQLGIKLAAIDVGVGRREDDPLRAQPVENALYLVGLANVGIVAPQAR